LDKECILTHRNGKALSFLGICIFAIFLLECRLFEGMKNAERMKIREQLRQNAKRST